MRMKLFKLLMESIVWCAITVAEIFLRFDQEYVLEMFDKIEECKCDGALDVISPVVLKKRKKYERKLNKRKES